MTAVYKYPIPWPPGSDVFALALPGGARPLTVQVQDEVPCIWALVDPAQPVDVRLFRVAGTGHPIDDPLAPNAYVGTFQLRGGELVFHIFEITG